MVARAGAGAGQRRLRWGASSAPLGERRTPRSRPRRCRERADARRAGRAELRVPGSHRGLGASPRGSARARPRKPRTDGHPRRARGRRRGARWRPTADRDALVRVDPVCTARPRASAAESDVSGGPSRGRSPRTARPGWRIARATPSHRRGGLAAATEAVREAARAISRTAGGGVVRPRVVGDAELAGRFGPGAASEDDQGEERAEAGRRGWLRGRAPVRLAGDVGARGLAIIWGRFCLAARSADDERTWRVTTIGPDLARPSVVTLQLGA